MFLKLLVKFNDAGTVLISKFTVASALPPLAWPRLAFINHFPSVRLPFKLNALALITLLSSESNSTSTRSFKFFVAAIGNGSALNNFALGVSPSSLLSERNRSGLSSISPTNSLVVLMAESSFSGILVS